MSEFKLQKLVRELIDVCEAPASPEHFIEKLTALDADFANRPTSVDKCFNELKDSAPETSRDQFSSKYSDLQEKKLDVLPKYIELLHHIKQDKKLSAVLARRALNQSRKKASNTISTGVPEPSTIDEALKIQSKLVKVVDKITTKIHSKEGEATENLANVSRRRPFLSQDFIYNSDALYPPLPLDGVPQSTQDYYLVDDVLSLMLGCNGKYITVEPPSVPYELPTFSFPPNTDVLLKNLLVQILPVAAHYSVIAHFLLEKQALNSGRINQALAAAITSLMSDYKIFVIQMENLHRQHDLKLEKLWCYAYPVTHSVMILSKIAQSIGKSKAFGGRTLSILYQESIQTAADLKASQTCQYLLKSASVPFFESLDKWINKGRVFDPFNEFMIEDNVVIESSSFLVKGECSDEYWAKRYMIRKMYVPGFLEKVGEKILRSGKYLNVIRLCKNKKIKEMFPPPMENLSYDPVNKSYLDAIDRAYEFSSSALLKLIMEEYDLVNRFRTMKRYFMLEQGDFLMLLMESCEAELQKLIDDVVPNRLEVLLDLAIRMCSSGKIDPYKDDICMVLHPCQFYFHMSKILNISTPKEMEFRYLKEEEKCQTGLEAFSLGLSVKWPMSLVFNQRVLAFYQMIFRLLLICKHCERQLCRVWLCDKNIKQLDVEGRQGYQKAFSLRQRMLFCIQNFAFYITEEIIEPNFNLFMMELKKAKDIDHVLELHSQYLEKSVSDCMLTNVALLENLKLMMSKCEEFCDFMLEQHYSVDTLTPETLETFDETVENIDFSFTEILLNFFNLIDRSSKEKQFSKISGIVSRWMEGISNTNKSTASTYSVSRTESVISSSFPSLI
nr:PREDICTED: gamma-tubulin complex component 2-like [Bemisia tabaci]